MTRKHQTRPKPTKKRGAARPDPELREEQWEVLCTKAPRGFRDHVGLRGALTLGYDSSKCVEATFDPDDEKIENGVLPVFRLVRETDEKRGVDVFRVRTEDRLSFEFVLDEDDEDADEGEEDAGEGGETRVAGVLAVRRGQPAVPLRRDASGSRCGTVVPLYAGERRKPATRAARASHA